MTRKPFSKKTATVEVRIAPERKESFVQTCEKDGRSASDVLRSLMESYVQGVNRAPGNRSKEFAMLKVLAKRPRRVVAVTVAVAATGLVPATSAASDGRLQAAFLWIDADGSRAITPGELFAQRQDSPLGEGAELILTTKGGQVPGETPRDIFARLDNDDDGGISLAEMDRAVEVTSVLDPSIFAADQDGDAAVSPSELAAHLATTRAASGASKPAVGTALMTAGLLEAHDLDGNGVISRSDLAAR
jgi:hypothetical protein